MALTMDQLNAVYNDMSVYGDTYKNSVAPMAVNTIPSIPDVAPINNIPVLPMQYINQGGNDGGIKSLGAIDYGYDSVFDNTNITPIMPNGEEQPQTNFEYDIEEGSIPQEDIDNNRKGILESLLSLPKQVMETYMKYGPIGQVKRGIEFVKEKKEERAIKKAQEEAKKEQQVIESIRQQYAAKGRDYGQGAADGSGGYNEGDGGSYSGASTQDYGGGEKDGGHIDGTNRRPYGKGGIVTL